MNRRILGFLLAFLPAALFGSAASGVAPWLYPSPPTNGQTWTYSTVYNAWIPGAGSSGTVTSIGPDANNNLTFTPNPITGTGTIGFNLNKANVFTANQTAPVFISNVATGTAPLTVTSTTTVPNLSVNVASAGDYATGTWSPVLNSFTIVNGTGGITVTGYYTAIGNLVFARAVINGTGSATVASVAGTSNISGLPFTVANAPSGTYVSGSFIIANSFVAGGVGARATNMYPGTWSAVTPSSTGTIDIDITYLK